MNREPRMTPKRRAWLERLRDHGPAVRHSTVGYWCMQFGWTEWWVTLDDGRQMFMDAARPLYTPPDFYWEHIMRDPDGTPEMITEAGRKALEAAP